MNPAGDSRVLCFGAFRLDVRCGKLFCGDVEVSLQPRAWEVLCYFAERPGEIISVDELLDHCWKDANVSLQAVSNAIHRLRATFTVGGGQAEWIQSVSRRGYRFAAPVRLEAARAAPALDAPSGPEHESPAAARLFVGRQRELGFLQARWQQARAGSSLVVFVSGEPGIGKSSLVRHFCATIEQPSPPYVGRCTAQQREGEPYMPVLEALGSVAWTAEVVALAREHAPTWLIQMPWLLAAEDRAALRHSLAGIGPSRMLREGKRLFALLAERTPLLLVLEDVHWADTATVDLIRALAQDDHQGRGMLIATYRSSEVIVQAHPLRDIASELAVRLPNVSRLSLDSLSPFAVHEYLARRFGNEQLAAELAPRLEERSGGNPLFLEAITSYLCEEGTIAQELGQWRLVTAIDDVEIGLPDSLREMIRAQLHQLDRADEHLLRAASVAGVDFTALEVAAALEIAPAEAEEACSDLERRGHFVRALGEVSWPDGSITATYRFAHAAYHQAMIEEIAPNRRRSFHARVGARLAEGYGKRAREIAPRLAAHFEAAGDLEREFEYLKLSVQLSAGRYAHRQTLAYMDRTLEVLARLPVTEERTSLRLGWQVERSNLCMDWQGYAGGYDSFACVIELARQQGNTFLEFIGQVGCALSGLLGRVHRGEARAHVEAAMAIAVDGHPELMALAHLEIGCVCDSFGDPRTGLAHAEAALTFLPDAILGVPRGYDLETLIRVALMTCLTRLGQTERAAHERALVVQGAQTKAGLGGKAHGFAFAACDALISQEPALAFELAGRAIEGAREGGFDHFAHIGEAALEAARSMLAPDDGIDPEGLRRLSAAIERRHELGENWYNMLLAAYLADGYRRRGEIERARLQIDGAFADAEAVYLPELWRIKGCIELAAANADPSVSRSAPPETAARCFRTAIAIAREHGTKLFEQRAELALAGLYADDGVGGQVLAQPRASAQS